LRGYWIPRDRYTEIRAAAMVDPRLEWPVTAGPPRQPEGE
jgi:hypothetical protein